MYSSRSNNMNSIIQFDRNKIIINVWNIHDFKIYLILSCHNFIDPLQRVVHDLFFELIPAINF